MWWAMAMPIADIDILDIDEKRNKQELISAKMSTNSYMVMVYVSTFNNKLANICEQYNTLYDT